MRSVLPQTLAGLLLVGGAGALSHAEAVAAPARSEPLALLLAPLGPAKALLSSALWVAVLHEQRHGDPESLLPLARALLDVHPGLDTVREFLAGQLIVTEAPRATDAARHAALVQAGLAMLEDGRQLSDSPRLHVTLGRLLCIRRVQDQAFEPVAEAYFGSSLPDVAIEALAHSRELDDARLRAELLVERGLLAVDDHEMGEARADYAEAQSAIAPLRGRSADEDAQLDALLLPLHRALGW